MRFCICKVNSEYVNGSFMFCRAFEKRDMHRFRIFFWNYPFLSRLYKFYLSINRTNSIYCKIFIYIHKNLFATQAQDLLEKLAEILLYNIYREHILLKLKIKKLLRKIKSKNLTHPSPTGKLKTFMIFYN